MSDFAITSSLLGFHKEAPQEILEAPEQNKGAPQQNKEAPQQNKEAPQQNLEALFLLFAFCY